MMPASTGTLQVRATRTPGHQRGHDIASLLMTNEVAKADVGQSWVLTANVSFIRSEIR